MRVTVGLFLLITMFASAGQACFDKREIYKVCSDQVASFDEASTRADKSSKLLLVKFGYHQCGWCQSLHKIFHDQVFWSPLDTSFQLVEVGMFRKTPEKFVRVKDGFTILNQIRNANGLLEAYEGGYPLLAVIRPDNQTAVFIDTGDLETDKGHSRDAILTALDAAKNQLSQD